VVTFKNMISRNKYAKQNDAFKNVIQCTYPVFLDYFPIAFALSR